MTLDQVVGRFPSAKRAGAGYALQCPVHEDRVASVSATEKDGRVLIHCHAGCATADILSSVGLTLADLFEEVIRVPEPTPVLRSTSAAAVYDYTDLDGTLLHQVVRGADKSFRQRRPDGAGGWIWSASKTRALYRWPDLTGQPVIWVVEGEKDVDTCRAHGLAATTNCGGAGKWKAEETAALVALAPTQVYVVPDHDVPGRRHAASVVEQLTTAGLSARLVVLPGLQAHGDVSDWFASGGTAARLLDLATAPPVEMPVIEHGSIPDLLRSEQTFTKLGEGAYSLEYPALGITLRAEQLHRDRDRDLHGELTVTTTLMGAKTIDGVLLWSSANFSSQRTRATLAQSCAGRSGAAGLDWLGAVETLSLRVQQAESEGTPIQPLADYGLPEVVSNWEVSGIPILQRHPMILFGDGGSAKSYLALHIASTLARRGIKVLYGDWEFSPEDHRERLERLCGWDGMPRDTLHYVRCASPMVSEAARLQRHIVQHGIQYFVCDSVGFAVPGRPEDAEHATAFFRAVRQLGVGSLHLAHTTKSLEHGEDKPFGSTFWSNGARSMFHIKRSNDAGDGANVIEVALSHKKSNTSRRLPAFGLRLTFDQTTTRVDRFDVASSEELSAVLPVWQRIKALVAHRPLSVEELATELGEKTDTIGRTIRRMDGVFARDPDQRIRLAVSLTSSQQAGRF